ncbi:hypothetical protein Tco_1574109, partial [Tanacetum coccineum]
GVLLLLLQLFILAATTLRHRGDPIILCIAPRLWHSGLSSVVYSCLLGTNFSYLEVLKGLILNIPGAITLSFCTTFDSCGEGTEFEVTGFDKACVSSILGRPLDFGKGVTE